MGFLQEMPLRDTYLDIFAFPQIEESAKEKSLQLCSNGRILNPISDVRFNRV
jgi:hypothetical protein